MRWAGWGLVLVIVGLVAGCIAPGGGLDRGGALDTVPEETYQGTGEMLPVAYCLQSFITNEDCNSTIQDAVLVPAADGQSIAVMCDLSRYFGSGNGASMGAAVGSGQGLMGMAVGSLMGAAAHAAASPGEGQFAPVYSMTVRQVGKDRVEIRNWTANQLFQVDSRLAMMRSAVDACIDGKTVAPHASSMGKPPVGSPSPSAAPVPATPDAAGKTAP